MAGATEALIGPLLFLDHVDAHSVLLSALFIVPKGAEAPPPIEVDEGEVWPQRLATFDRGDVYRARFALPADRPSSYRFNGTKFPVASDLSGDLRLAYVSCNGEEVGDMARAGSERNAMWARLVDQHHRQPIALLLHGGDQLYADEITQHHPLSRGWPDDVPADPSPEDLSVLAHVLREGFFARYVALCAAPEFAFLAARVPSLMQWDDHDICDGWGSLKPTASNSAIGQTLFSVARETYLLFQQAAVDGDLPRRFHDPAGLHLGWCVEAPQLRILAPDLRSERTRRAIMGRGGWAMMEAQAQHEARGHTLLMSSVPLLGPRLSLVEAMLMAIPRMQRYEDDLRDQWQSRAHREEWRRMLRLARTIAQRDGHDVTAISGEIHLAGRAVMALGDELSLHQLVASGIAHRAPPRAWARALSALAALGEDPLEDHPIRIERLPGQRLRYVAERNYLLIERHEGIWTARWDLEKSGLTTPLRL